MAFSYRKFLNGLRIKPKAVLANSEKGDLEVSDVTNKLNFHNGSVNSPVVTELTINSVVSASVTNITNANVSPSAGIVYSKLDLTDSIKNADVSSVANIAIGKLAGTNANRLIASNGAGNTLGQVAAITAGQALISDSNGLPVGEAQLDETRGGTGIGSYSTGDIVYASAPNTLEKLPIGAANRVLQSNGTIPSWNVIETLPSTGTSNQYLKSVSGSQPVWQTGYILGSFQTFTSSTSWTRPANCRAILVEVVGGGGGSGGSAASGGSTFGEAGGGGGGGYSRRWITNPGATETVTVGAGGTAATAGANAGGTGGTSSFGAFCSATGGTGGAGVTPNSGTVRAAPGTGGVGSGGDFNVAGGDGGQGTNAGGVRISTGYGGNSYFAGQRRQLFASGGQNAGSAGYAWGGGASGASQDASQSAIGGSAGGAGGVIVWEFY